MKVIGIFDNVHMKYYENEFYDETIATNWETRQEK